MSVRRTAVRSLGVLALVAPMSVSFALAAAPSALAADSDFSSPAAGQDFTGQPASVDVKASVPACPQTLPGICNSNPTTTLTVKSVAGSLSASKTATKATQTVTVTVPASSANAAWTATLSGGNTGTRSFTTNFDPAAPSSFSAQGSGARDVSFVWNKGSEPDLTGYTLTDGNGNVIDNDITTSSASCAGSSPCSYGLYYPSDNPGTHDYRLIAKRSSASGGTLSSSPASASATLTVPPKPTPSATSGPTTSPGAGGTTGGSSTGGSTGSGSTGGSTASGSSGGSSTGSSGGAIGNAGPGPTLPANATNPVLAQRRAFALTFNAFSPSLGIPKLPPLPATNLPSLEQPLPLGTYKPALPYSSQSETTKTTSILSSPTAFVHSFTDSTQLATDIAVALILLLVAGHLRRYLGKHVEE